MTTYYVIDTRTDDIVNAIDVSGSRVPELSPERWESAEFLRFDTNPPLRQLERYRYWNERP